MTISQPDRVQPPQSCGPYLLMATTYLAIPAGSEAQVAPASARGATTQEVVAIEPPSVPLHHPAYSSGPHGGSRVERPTAAIRTRWMPLFRERGVDLLFAGHEHLFEHWTEHYRNGIGEWRLMDQSDNPHQYVVVHVDGPDVWIEVVGVAWGIGFRPYRSSRTGLSDGLEE